MRKFLALDKQSQLNLRKKFPDLDKLVAVEQTDAYTYMAISVFDRWLGEEDSIKYLSDVSVEEQNSRDSKFVKFAKKLIDNTEVLNFTFKGRWISATPQFRKFTSNTAKEKYLMCAQHNVDSSHFYKVVLPELEAVYFESWDDTNVFYLRNPEHAVQIAKWANECGLYRLNR
ncbi:hypothetical protein Q4524_17600 [Alteromonas stellipolaris]|jgi:hypothetical protein|uniref:hypothetical protein n=1 Tax=Alteromonas stellipolaris TaxID=233316 RepID=UPI0026E247CD|nr:hypothetical protein [Alteromonas stellipolaris]MDO6540404.1 hypothetical protein [Alteromonas stellipolaris]